MARNSKKFDLGSRQDIGVLDDRDLYERTKLMYVLNETPFSIKICFFQAKCSFDLPDPYIKDTGVFVGGVNLPNGADATADPWDAGGIRRPIAGTTGSCSLEITDGTSTKTINRHHTPMLAKVNIIRLWDGE